jgi:hypothetical protein
MELECITVFTGAGRTSVTARTKRMTTGSSGPINGGVKNSGITALAASRSSSVAVRTKKAGVLLVCGLGRTDCSNMSVQTPAELSKFLELLTA